MITEVTIYVPARNGGTSAIVWSTNEGRGQRARSIEVGRDSVTVEDTTGVVRGYRYMPFDYVETKRN